MPVLPDKLTGALRVPVHLLYEAGWAGVDLFFVLSGFLISGLLFREHQQYRRIDFKQFIVRRGLKIYPGFYCLIAATVGIAVLNKWNLPWKRIFAEVFFVQNYFIGLWSHTWSLAIEEHFYLLLPLLLIALARINKLNEDPFRLLPWLYVGLASVLLGLRLLSGWIVSFDFVDVNTFCHRHLFPSHLRLDSLFLGVVLAYAYHYHPAALKDWVLRRQAFLLGVAVMAVLPIFIWPLINTPYHYTVGFTLLAYGFAAILLLSVTKGYPAGGFFGPPVHWCAYIGAHSYSIYLWHLAVGMLATEAVLRWRAPWWVEPLAFLAGSILVGIIMAKLIELPMLKVRDRFFPSRSKLPAAAKSSQ
jgi:peptidoglycan/LPS O-acetylase OafA/YrhL